MIANLQVKRRESLASRMPHRIAFWENERPPVNLKAIRARLAARSRPIDLTALFLGSRFHETDSSRSGHASRPRGFARAARSAQYGYPSRIWWLRLGRLGRWHRAGEHRRRLGHVQHGPRYLQPGHRAGPVDQRSTRACAGTSTSTRRSRTPTACTTRSWPGNSTEHHGDARIEDRLRNHPETRDITDGDALNVLLDVLLNPGDRRQSLQYVKTPLRPD